MTARLTPVPGLGVVARNGETIIAVLVTDGRADAIIDVWLNSPDPVVALISHLETLPGPPPPVAAVAFGSGAVVVAAAGGMEVTCELAGGTRRITAPAGLQHEAIADAVYTVTAVAAGAGAPVDSRTRLDGGIIAAAGFVLDLAAAPAIAPTPVAPPANVDPDPTGSHRFAPVTGPERAAKVISRLPDTPVASGSRLRLYSPPPPAVGPTPLERPPAEHSSTSGRILLIDAPLPAFEPLPLATNGPATPLPIDHVNDVVLGIRCTRNHLNDPDAYYCAQCGIAMVNLTHQLSEGRRPSLGFLVFDDGAAYTLDDNYVVGRAPHDDARVDDGDVRPLTIDDRSRTVSRVHADIVLEGWHVHLIDRNSTNGSYLWDEPTGSWVRLPAGESVRLTPGCHASIGQRVFRFESPHEQKV